MKCSEGTPRSFPSVSVIIPARNESGRIGALVESVIRQAGNGWDLEVIVVDDGSTDGTGEKACVAGARTIRVGDGASSGNPAAARNRGAMEAKGDPLIFLDADCTPGEGWLDSILAAHEGGATVVGGSLGLPPGLPAMARCDYYCGWYLVHPDRKAGTVPHHPPPNLSVRREAFFRTQGYSEQPPMDYTNEERGWLGELTKEGHRIHFEPRAVAYHHNRPGFGNLLRRNYRWGYTAIESKHGTGAARISWLYRYPEVLLLASPIIPFVHTAYILACWLRAGKIEPVLMLPAVIASRCSYTLGMVVGGIRWIRGGDAVDAGARPRPRWK